MKTEKRKANVGERILVTNAGATQGRYANGDIGTVCHHCEASDDLVYVSEWFQPLFAKEYEVIVAQPKKSARITALESQVATLQAKVEALESAGKYPLTAQFERESTSNCEAVDAILADIERKAKPTSPNEQRADVIKRAKAFVGEGFDRWLGNSLCTVEFIVNTDKRTVVALAHRKFLSHTQVVRKGIAKCDPDDIFNADIGKAIALARALGVEVPTEFVKAVQPTEVVVGQRIQSIVLGNEYYRVTEIDGRKARVNDTTMYYGVDRINIAFKITDDTDAVYE